MQEHISMWFPLHLHENIHEEDVMHLKRMERKYDFDLLIGLEEVFLWTKSSRVLIEVAICIWYRYAKHRVNVIFFLTLQMQNILSPGLWPQIERMLLYSYLWGRERGRTINTIDEVCRRAA